MTMGERYAFLVEGEISPRRAAWFDGLTMTPIPGGYTLISGPVPDQAALHGILAKIRDLGLSLDVAVALKRDERVEKEAQ